MFTNRNIFFTLLMFYIASLIVFALPSNVIYSNIIGVLLIGYFIIYKLYKQEFNLAINEMLIFYAIFIFFAWASFFWSAASELTVKNGQILINVLIILVVTFNIIKNFDIMNAVLYGVMIGMAFNYLLYFNIIHVNYNTWLWARYQGSTGNPNNLAITAIFSIFSTILLIYKEKIKNNIVLLLFYINILLSIYMIILSSSKKGLIFGSLLILGYFASLIREKKQLFKLLLFLLFATLILKFYLDANHIVLNFDNVIKRFEEFILTLEGKAYDKSAVERLTFIHEGFLLASHSPFIGHGLNTFRKFFGLYAHNNYIELFFDVGFIGLSLYYYIYFKLIKNSLTIKSILIKRFVLFFLFILLLMDIAFVSYYNKLLLIYLITLSYFITQKTYTFSNERSFSG